MARKGNVIRPKTGIGAGRGMPGGGRGGKNIWTSDKSGCGSRKKKKKSK